MITPTAIIQCTRDKAMPLMVTIKRGDEVLSEHPVANAQLAEARIRIELGNLQQADGAVRSHEARPADVPAVPTDQPKDVAASFGWRG